jgi:hypothetical protein
MGLLRNSTGELRSQTLAVLITLSAALFVAGCGKGNQLGYVQHDEELHSTDGTVLVDGKPARNATIILHRSGSATVTGIVPDDPSKILPNPQGDCDENGYFQLYTYMPYDGAPAGDYLVTISWSDPEGRNRDGENYPELLPRNYQSPQKSELKATILLGENHLEIPEIKLTSGRQ